jgi:vitamin B12 transporter
VLETSSVQQQVTVTATGLPTPLAQSSSAVTLIPDSDLATSIGVIDALRQSPGVAVVQTGQAGGVTSLFVRGGNSTANQVLLDGIPMVDVGGVFDIGTLSTTGLAGIELYRGSNSALYGTDAGASVLNFETPRGSATKPQIDYSGEAGNFHSYRNQVSLSGTHRKLDYYTAFSRFETSNALPLDEDHTVTSVANLGYALTANTLARFTLLNADSATGLPDAHDFYGISANAREGDQDLYSGLTWRTAWRVDGTTSSATASVASAFRRSSSPTSARPSPSSPCLRALLYRVLRQHRNHSRGQRIFRHRPGRVLRPTDDEDSNRDELYYQSDYSFAHYLTALFGFHYERERGSFVEPPPLRSG